MCISPSVLFDQPPTYGSRNYGGVISLKSVPKDVTKMTYRNVCQCTLESTSGDVFDVMIRGRGAKIDDMCDANCRDQLDISHISSSGETSLHVPVIR